MDKTILTANHIHFTGIKGVGMTAAALCAQDRGAVVSGSDLDEHFVTDQTLSSRNIVPKIGFNTVNIDPTVDFVVYTGAHQGSNNPEVIAARDRGIPTISLAEATGQLMAGKQGISVCGVGGKTTTTAMLAAIFDAAGKDPSYLVGVASISNLAFPGRYRADSQQFIVEADEYATSPGIDHTPRFMHQSPKTVICTNISHDHPDIYPTIADTLTAYGSFFAKIPTDGHLVYNADDNNINTLLEHCQGQKIPVGFDLKSTYRIEKITPDNGELVVNYTKNGHADHLVLIIPGEFNAKNAVMALAVAETYGIGVEVVRTALLKFRGVNRRFQLMGNHGGALFYDDYAHHPTEIKHTLNAAKQWFPGKRIIAIFQPHTYSRTKTLMSDFAKSFTHADKVIITDIFASAREQIDPKVSAQLLVSNCEQFHPDVTYVKQADLVKYIDQIIEPEDVIFTIGAGDVYTFHESYFQKQS